MCRHTAWLGAERTLADLLLEREHGLLQQSWAPRRQRHGTVNADGWGAAWWTAAGPGPARWRRAAPLWADASLASVAPHVASGCVLGAVRDATVGMPPDETACAPFVRGAWALSHNGRLDRSVLPADAWPAAESVCDSAVLAAWLLQAPEEIGPRVRAAGEADPTARLNVLAADGTRLVATAWGDTLSVLRTDDGVVVASEPHDDDPRWQDVPDRSLVEVDARGARVSPL
ncbi:ergothioneine biosynthesis protein EgtC [Kineococcus sp. TBRC 1896]|uniref:Gamma-glutamyl-hercynylcysteine sulfoxide hydrolase n=1 Tax=Kineococcus mangrovi TaxID=1660183 RepID=A0ABV4I0B8_9ACTN